MSNYFYINLTAAVYRVSELLPKNEPLKQKIRQTADAILVDLIKNNADKCYRQIKVLDGLFDLAESRKWVDRRNFSVLRREYAKISGFLEDREGISSEKPLGKPVEKRLTTRFRKQKIMEVLKEKRRVKLRDLTQVFPQVSRRTLMRDMDGFFRSGTVIKAGSGPASCYNIKIVT